MWSRLVWISGLAAVAALWRIAPAGADEGPVARLSESDGRVEVRVRPGWDPADLASALGRELPKAQILVDGSTVVVEGAGIEAVRVVLDRAPVERSLDDVDALLADMREAGRGESGSGSSVRARRDLKTEGSEEDAAPIVGVVESVKRQRFPLVLVGVVVRTATEGARVKPDDRIVVLPRVRSRRGVIDPNDPQSKRNIGAWYVRPGDRVRVRLEPRPDGQPVWVAQSFERLTKGSE
jgi:hypothetical protein